MTVEDVFMRDATTWNAWTSEYAVCYYGDFTGKVILDIGGDMGSSAVWFIRHGASKVIVFEKDSKYYALWEEVRRNLGADGDKIEYRKEGANCDNIRSIVYDIVKMDCEGCEMELVCDDILSGKWMIAVHTFVAGWEALESKLVLYGGRLVYDNGGERMYRNF
jgi:hypothetical protein